MSNKFNLQFLQDEKRLAFMQIQVINSTKLIDVLPVIRIMNLEATKAILIYTFTSKLVPNF